MYIYIYVCIVYQHEKINYKGVGEKGGVTLGQGISEPSPLNPKPKALNPNPYP